MRAVSTISSAAAAVAAFSGIATAFSATAKTNVVTYWGQGPNQSSLQSVCKNPNIDIVNIGFVNVFPDQGAAGWPGTNFGNACGSETYTYNGTSTQFLSNCPDVGSDIEICQSIYGKKIFLSIGGAYPTNYFINNSTSAANFAKFLWGAFGPSEAEWTQTGGPRPFGDAVVDGFDFDIESDLSTAPVVNGKAVTDYKTRGYANMIRTFRQTLFTQDTSKTYYISGAPQCEVPDAHFASVVSQVHFDFLFVQYYNTAACSARQAISSGSFTGYTNWASVKSYNTNVKLYIGLPASTNAANDTSYYLKPSEVKTLVGKVYSNSRFGGIMLWEATYAARNIICNKDYATWMKQILVAQADGTSINTATNPCPAQPISKDGTCGEYNGYTCTGSIFGSCCSIYGYCGSSAEYCNTATCDTKGGNCGSKYVAVSSSKKVSSTSSSKKVSSTSSSKKVSSTSSSKKTSSTSSSKKVSSTSTKKATSTSTKKASTSTSKKVTSSVPVARARFAVGASNFTAAAVSAAGSFYDSSAAIATGSVAGTAAVSAGVSPSGAFPSMKAPYSNSTTYRAYGANANAAFALPRSTVYTTSTVYQTLVQTVTSTNAQGAESTVHVTNTIKLYTTVYPVATAVSNAGPGNADDASGSSQSVQDPRSTVYFTDTFYTTIYPSATASSNHGHGFGHGHGHVHHAHGSSSSSSSQVADLTGGHVEADTLANVAQDPRYTAVVKTIYTTAVVTTTIQMKTVVQTSTYALTTTVQFQPASMSTTTTTVRSTFYTTKTIEAAASVAPFAFNNGTAALRFAASGNVLYNAVAASKSPSTLAMAASSSLSSSSPAVVVHTHTVVPVAQESVQAAAAASVYNGPVYGNSFLQNVSAYHMKAVHPTGAASSTRVEIGLCTIAVILAALFVL